MIEELKQFLLTYRNKTIELHRLQEQFPRVEYAVLAPLIQTLMAEGVLVGFQDVNAKKPPLPKRYKVISALLQGDFLEQLRNLQLKRHPMISLDAYYKLGAEALRQDLPWMEKLERYLAERDLSADRQRGIPLPEASYRMVGDEKWLEEAGGLGFLKRVGLTPEVLGLTPVLEPLMWAFHPAQADKPAHRHLIIENKSTYHALLQQFSQQSVYTTLVYGRGKAILANMPLFYQQTGLDPRGSHVFEYFGDLDYEGIGIWHSLSQTWPCAPAVSLYRHLLKKPHGPGKENHRPVQAALHAFQCFFTEAEASFVQDMLERGHYLPQEAVTSAEWEAYGREHHE